MPKELEPEEQETFNEAIAAFNSGDYYRAHDLFESLWGEELFRALVQASVALHHYSVGNLAGVAGLPGRVRQVIAPYLPSRFGLDLARFAREFEEFMRKVQAGEEPEMEKAPRLRMR